MKRSSPCRRAIRRRPWARVRGAKAALQAGEIDALVVDIPTGFEIAKSQIEGSVLVGQFPRPNEVTEFFGLVLQKGSKLTGCVSAAVDSLFQDGTLDKLGVRLTTLSPEQASYLGVSPNGPYKPAHYRY